MMLPIRVSFLFKHDIVAGDGVRYICAEVMLHHDAAPATGLWDHLKVGLWIPYHEKATIAELREAALAKAQADASLFANMPRERFQFVSESGI